MDSSRKHNRYYYKTILQISLFLLFTATSIAQRTDQVINNGWKYAIVNGEQSAIQKSAYSWNKVTLPHNADDYFGYRRLLHGNLHGNLIYSRSISIKKIRGKQYFLFFEGVSSYAQVYVNGILTGSHAGGRTTFTVNITSYIKAENTILVKVAHPAFIKDLPWVCGGCSDERGFSEGSQPMGIFRPVHLIVTNDIKVAPFGVHAWADIKDNTAALSVNTTLKNYAAQKRNVTIINQLADATNTIVKEVAIQQALMPNDSITVLQNDIAVDDPILWSTAHPYLYKIITTIKENNLIVDRTETAFGFRTINWKTASHQFLLNGKPVFINGIAEYEHLLGGSHAFSNEEIIARMNWIQNAGFNALRDAHQPHNLLYGKLCDERGLLWWTQFSAHIWYDTPEFRKNFKTLLREWVIERRNEPSLILWGLQNESKLPKDFAEECTALIRSLDPTASTQRLVTTCNGGEGTDWDVPQNWTGTYGGDPATYAQDIKKQILVGEYGAWRTLGLHTEGGFQQNGPLSEERMALLMEQKIRLAESVKDSCAGQFFWLLTSHDNPGRVQGGEGLREMDRVGPVNYKGMLTPWEEPMEAYYMFRSNYVAAAKQPMVHIDSHTWPNRWITPGIKDSINVFSNCDEVELFNDVNGLSLGKQKRNGIGTHFQWNKVTIQYNVLYAVGYVNGKAVAGDTVVLFHLPEAPHYNQLFTGDKNVTRGKEGYQDVYRVNCGGPEYTDVFQQQWDADDYYSDSWTSNFSGMPKNFASQRRTFAPIKNTADWKIFQSFRYGKNKLRYDFDVNDDEMYRVELYFIEPWLGTAGENAAGMRLFDVAINGNTVIKNLDIWKEAGSNTVLKKVFTVKPVDGKISISFPSSNAGQAIISGLVVAKKKNALPVRTAYKRPSGSWNWKSWLDIGDKIFANLRYQFHSIPSELFGAHWMQLKSPTDTKIIDHALYDTLDIYLAIAGKANAEVIKGFAKINETIVTSENGGKIYEVYKKRCNKGDTLRVVLDSSMLLLYQPVNNMQPAYDLKPTQSYRPNAANFNNTNATKEIVNGKESIRYKQNNTAIEWKVNIGAADIYSINLRYSNETGKSLSGKMQWIMADGTIMKEEKIIFTTSEKGKWNYFTTNTRTMVNAGNYIVRIIADDAIGVSISGVDIQ
ncbi:MAG: DUF4982 domain-containing protein [Bacteroidetes bacterium]|nr:DUF4982 domain-containing protein [Bacteroidota bacterium]